MIYLVLNLFTPYLYEQWQTSTKHMTSIESTLHKPTFYLHSTSVESDNVFDYMLANPILNLSSKLPNVKMLVRVWIDVTGLSNWCHYWILYKINFFVSLRSTRRCSAHGLMTQPEVRIICSRKISHLIL